MPTAIDNQRTRQLVDHDHAQLVEVLHPESFQALHLPEAINMPLEEIDERASTDLDRGRPVIVYCWDYQ